MVSTCAIPIGATLIDSGEVNCTMTIICNYQSLIEWTSHHPSKVERIRPLEGDFVINLFVCATTDI
jgi:hypothetical protein